MYISGDPVKLGRFLTFNWRAGIAKDYYGYQNEIRENKYYSVGLMGGYRAVSGWINYTNRAITGYTPYLYDTFSTTKPIDIGFRLELTPKDAVSVSWTIDAKMVMWITAIILTTGICIHSMDGSVMTRWKRKQHL